MALPLQSWSVAFVGGARVDINLVLHGRIRHMNWDQIGGEWKQLKAGVKSRWAKLTDDDLKDLSAKKDELVGKIQERYGTLKEDAEREVDEWIAKVKGAHDDHKPGPPKP